MAIGQEVRTITGTDLLSLQLTSSDTRHWKEEDMSSASTTDHSTNDLDAWHTTYLYLYPNENYDRVSNRKIHVTGI